MKQTFKLKIELPDGWLLDKETLKIFVEGKTILKVLDIE